MGDFGKLNFSVSFNRTSAFPIEANGYFETLEEAQAAAATAVEVGSAESTYYIGQTLTVVTEGNAKNYIIQPDKTLLEVGSGSTEIAITDGEEPQGDEVLWVDMNEDTSSSLEELGIQPKLESGVNIKTINGESILGEGDIVISSSGDGEIPVLDLTEIPNVFTFAESTTISDELYSQIQEAYNNGVKLCLIGDYGGTHTRAPLDIMYLEGRYILNIEMPLYISGHYTKRTSLITVRSASSVSILPNIYLFPTSLDGSNNTLSLVSDDEVLDCLMKGYSKPSSYSAINSSDSINEAIGKLEAGIIPDAPSDGRKYARMDGTWVRVEENFSIIEINQTISDPSSMITGDVNGKIIQWIRSNSHRVLAKKTGEGTVTYIELDDTNSNRYALDGSEAKTDGTEGDVFVKLPTFYYSGTEGDNIKIKFSKEQFEGCVKWDENILIGAYEAYYENSKLQSRSGVESSANISKSNFKTYASNRGKGYQLVDWQMHCVLGCLFYAMYGNTNSQAICGKGTSSYTKQCGETNILGMEDTKAETNGNTMSINFWGLENWWGNKIECMQENGITTKMDTYDPVTNSTRSIPISPYVGPYARKMTFGRYLDLIASSNSNSSSDSIGYCDSHFWQSSPSANNTITRSQNGNEGYCGVSAIMTVRFNPDGNINEYNGSRIAFRGVCTKAESVEAFKALPVL